MKGREIMNLGEVEADKGRRVESENLDMIDIEIGIEVEEGMTTEGGIVIGEGEV